MTHAHIRRIVVQTLGMACIAASMSCASGGGGSGAAPGRSSVSRREERVLVRSYSDVQGVAASRRYVYAATTGGLAVYDRNFDAWVTPSAQEMSLSEGRVTAMAADPLEDAVWYGVPGAVVLYRPLFDQSQRTMIVGVPDLIAFERTGNGDALVRAGGQWTRVTRTGSTTLLNGQPAAASRLILPTTLEDVYQRFPGLRSELTLLMRDPAPNRPMRTFQVISGALSPDRTTETWLGTNGDGLWKVDATFQQATPLRFGLMEPGVGALALAADGVWSAGLGQSHLRGGLTHATSDLQRWQWIDGTITVPLAGVRAYALAVRAQRAWIGTDRGLFSIELTGAQDVTALSTLEGMPGDRVYAVATRPGGVWAGTDRGLVWVNDSVDARNRRTRGIGRILLENVAIRALQAVGDTLWIGTDAGILALPGGNASLARPVGDDPALRRPVRAIAWSDTALIVVTDDAVLRLAPRGNAAPSRIDADPRTLGQVTRVAIDAQTIWIAGTDGVLVLQRNSNASRTLRVGSDLPGTVLDVVASRDWLWIGTTRGLMRLRRASDGGIL